jgi:hypothetical protein
MLGLTPTRNLLFLSGATFFWFFGMAAQSAVGNNFQVETLQMGGLDRGFMEGGRELPGLLMVFISALTVAVPVPRLASLSILTMALQYFGFSFVSDIPQAIGLVIFGSIGFHMWAPLSRELNLSLGSKAQSGRVLGFMGGVGSAGGLLGMITVYFFAPSLGYRTMFLWAAIGLVLATILVSRVKSPRAPEHEKRARFILRREYSFYYLLTFLEGSARQIWGSFALFTIVENFHVDVQTIALMLIANSLLTMFVNPRIGIWIDQWGERRALMVGYGGLILVFTAFAMNVEAWIAIAVFFTYSTMFAFNMATPSYLHKIARPGELSPSLAMGVTFEHLAGVVIPIIGGYFWMTYGYRYAFLIGALVAVICFLAVTRLPKGRLVAASEGPVMA